MEDDQRSSGSGPPHNAKDRLQKGCTFTDFSELHEAVKAYERETYCLLKNVDSKTVAVANRTIKGPQFPDRFKYSYIKFACKHHGTYKSRGRGERPHQRTHKLGCPMAVYVKTDRFKQCMVILTSYHEHNHDTGPDFYCQYPENRRLHGKEVDLCSSMLKMKVKSHVMREQLHALSGKCLTNKDVHNIRSKIRMDETGGASNEELLLQQISNILEKDPGASLKISASDDGIIQVIYIQTSYMKSVAAKFPELFLLDATYKTNEHRMPLYTMMVEDGNGVSMPIAHFWLANECKSTLNIAFEYFAAHNNTNNTKLFLIDKDFNEVDLITKYFPNSSIHFCLFHVLKTFKQKTQGLQPKVRDCVRQILQELAYSPSLELYDKTLISLKSQAPTEFYNYFAANWDNCRHRWVHYERRLTCNFSNRTTNRLESYHQKLKAVLDSSKTLPEVIRSVLMISASKELMNDRHGFLQSVTHYYNTSHLSSPDMQSVYDILTPYASRLTEPELVAAESDNKPNVKLEGWGYVVTDKDTKCTRLVDLDGTKCSCTFNSCNGLPCRHVFAVRNYCKLPIITEAIVNQRWLQTFQKTQAQGMPVQRASKVTQSPKKAKQLLSRGQKYSRALSLVKDVASLIADCGRSDYEKRMSVIKDMYDKWLDGKDISVVETSAATLTHDTVLQLTSASTSESSAISNVEGNLSNHAENNPRVVAGKLSECGLPTIVPPVKKLILRPVNCNVKTIKTPTSIQISQATSSQLLDEVSEPSSDVPKLHQSEVHVQLATTGNSTFNKQEQLDNNTGNHLHINSDDCITTADIAATDTHSTECANTANDYPMHGANAKFLQPKDACSNTIDNSGSTITSIKEAMFHRIVDGTPSRDKLKLLKKHKVKGRPGGLTQSATGLPYKRQQKRKHSISKINKKKKIKLDCKILKPDLLTILTACQRNPLPPVRSVLEVNLNSDHPSMSLYYEMVAIDGGKEYDSIFDDVVLMSGSGCRNFSKNPLVNMGEKSNHVMLATAVIQKAYMAKLKPTEIAATLDIIPFQSHVSLDVFNVTVPAEYIPKAVGGITLHKSSLKTLQPGGCLDDQIIHAYLTLIAKNIDDVMLLPTFAMTAVEEGRDPSSFFYPKVKMSTKRCVVVPIHSADHWILLIAYPEHHSVCIFDSIESIQSEKRVTKYCNLWSNYVKQRACYLEEATPGINWTLNRTVSSSLQKDGSSCGIFVLMNAEAVIKNKPPCVFRQCHVNMFRKWVLTCLLRKGQPPGDEMCELPFCDRPSGDKISWVRCDSCDRWLHCLCLGLKHVPTEITFVCPICPSQKDGSNQLPV